MKNAVILITSLLLFFTIGCTGSKNTTDANKPENASSSELTKDKSAYDLVDYLIRLPGVYIQGGGNNVSVTIRGPSSVLFSTEPLFVVNGQILGRSFYRAKNAVEMHEIESVRILKGLDAAIYGFQGANGVIIIDTSASSNQSALQD